MHRRTDFYVTIRAGCKINVISRYFIVRIAKPQIVQNNGLWCCNVVCKNDGMRCCNKLPGNNVDFATGPLVPRVQELSIVVAINARQLMAAFTLYGFDDQERTCRLWKRIFPSFNTQISYLQNEAIKLSILFTNKILRELDNKKILFYKLSFWYLLVKPVSVLVSSC